MNHLTDATTASILTGAFALGGAFIATLGSAYGAYRRSRAGHRLKLGKLLIHLVELRELHHSIREIGLSVGLSWMETLRRIEGGGGDLSKQLIGPLLSAANDLSELRPDLAIALRKHGNTMGAVVGNIETLADGSALFAEAGLEVTARNMNDVYLNASSDRMAELDDAIRTVARMHGWCTYRRLLVQQRNGVAIAQTYGAWMERMRGWVEEDGYTMPSGPEAAAAVPDTLPRDTTPRCDDR